MHVKILITDVELCVNNFLGLSRGAGDQGGNVKLLHGTGIWNKTRPMVGEVKEGRSVFDKPLNKKMVDYTMSFFPKGDFSTEVGEGGQSVSFNVDCCYDIDNGLELYGEDNDHILFVSAGVNVTELKSLGTICDNIIKNPDALAIGNIGYSKERWYRIFQDLVYISVDNWKKIHKPIFGSWERLHFQDTTSDYAWPDNTEHSTEQWYLDEEGNMTTYLSVKDTSSQLTPVSIPYIYLNYTPMWILTDKEVPVVEESYDDEGILHIKNTGKRESINIPGDKYPGWNFIDMAYKNNLEIISWPFTIHKKWPWLYEESTGVFNDNS